MNFLKRNNVNKNKRKSIKINPIIKRTALTILTLIIVCSAYSNRAVFARPIEFVAKNIAKVAVYSVLPSFDSRQENVAILNEAEADTTSPSRIIESTTLKATSTTAKATANKTTTAVKAKAVNGNAKGKISIEALGYGGANLSLDNLHISNKTGLSVDLKKQLSIKPDIKIVKNKDPQVLIVHTHATEGYFPNVSNVYYDSPDWKLRKLGMGLRIRLYDNYAEQTLKSPISEHKMLETTDRLTHEEGQNFVDSGELKRDGFIAKKLAEHSINVADLEQVGQLSTVRYEIPAESGTYFLDASYYQDQNDYELEYETDDLENGIREFEQFLIARNINRRETVQKIARALKYPNK